MGGSTFDDKDVCIAFAREHLKHADPTYQCIPSLMCAMCLLSEEVIFKSNMQGDEVHMARTFRNPMQSAVVSSVNSAIPPILEGLKDGIMEFKFYFNTALTYEEWLLVSSHGGACKNLTDWVSRAFNQIKERINLTLGSHLAKALSSELHGEFLMQFMAIFITEISS